MEPRKYSEAQLRAAVARLQSMRQVLQRLSAAPFGGNYGVLRKAIKHFKLDTSHFTGQRWNRGLRLPPRQSLDLYLSNALPLAILQAQT